MRREINMVGEFHRKNNVSGTQRLTELKSTNPALERIGHELLRWSKTLQAELTEDDMTVLRSHLFVEEIGEGLIAMGQRNEAEVLDFLADLLYVTFGAALTFDLPLLEAFHEVHRSNMSKERQQSDPHGQRVRDKGPNYSPPDIERVISRCRLIERIGLDGYGPADLSLIGDVANLLVDSPEAAAAVREAVRAVKEQHAYGGAT